MPKWHISFFYSRTYRMQALPDKNELFIAGLYTPTTRRSNEVQERIEAPQRHELYKCLINYSNAQNGAISTTANARASRQESLYAIVQQFAHPAIRPDRDTPHAGRYTNAFPPDSHPDHTLRPATAGKPLKRLARQGNSLTAK